jgi:hypothetical protein
LGLIIVEQYDRYERKGSMKSSANDLVCIGFEDDGMKRVQTAASFLEIQMSFYKNADAVFEKSDELQRTRLILVSVVKVAKKEDIAGEVQVLRQFFPDAFIAVVAAKKMQLEDARFVKKSGCNYLFLENDFLNTTRLEYLMLQIVNAAYIPLKVADLQVNSTIDFRVMTIMPLNQKIVGVLHPETVITESRLNKIKCVEELFVRRDQVDLYMAYLAKHPDLTANGLANRCRVQLASVALAHSNLVLSLTDQAEAGSFDQGKILLNSCLELTRNLLETLAMLPEPWNVISQSNIGMLGGTDRSMSVAAMAAVASFACGLGSPENVMMAGLFCDLALLELSPKSLGKLNTNEGRASLTFEDEAVFKNHPITSLNRMLENKMQVTEEIKKIILCTHEQDNKLGFPNQVLSEKIPVEAAIILFHEMVDLEFRMTLGRKRESYPEVRKRVYDRENRPNGSFSLTVLLKMAEVIKGDAVA